jgi:hypothetical protein
MENKNENTVNIFNRGLVTDVKKKAQPQGSYTFALNAELETNNGDRFSIANAAGNELCVELPDNLQIIGTCGTNTDEILLFLTNNVTSEIGIYHPTSCSYTQLLRSSDLNFSTKYPVDCLFRIRKGCERTFYFTDRNNKYRTINIDSLLDYTDEVSTEQANLNDSWEIDRLSVSPSYDIPNIDLVAVLNSGGALKVGSYQFAIQLLDDDFNPTDWIFVTRPVPIVDEALSTTYDNINGGIPQLDNADPEVSTVPSTGKSIRLEITNLDQDYSYYRIAALHSTSTIGFVSEVWLTEARPISSSSQIFTYAGPNLNSDTLGSLSDINIDNAPINVVQAHAQVDQALWVGGIKDTTYNWADFQRAASKVTIQAIKKNVEVPNINNPGDPKSPFTPWDTQSMPPDEIVALAIQYAFSDGTWSPAFHIPGRPSNLDYTNCSTVLDDTSEISALDPNARHISGDGPYPRWRVYNTAVDKGNNRYLMGYHENLNSTYPDIKDCEGESIWGTDPCNNTLAGTPIRHHRIPSRRIINIYDESINSIAIIGLLEDNVTYPHPDIVGHRILMAEQNESDKTVLDTGILFGADERESDEFYSIPAEEYSGPQQSKDIPTWFISPRTLLLNDYLTGNHFKFLRRLEQLTPAADQEDVSTQGFFQPGVIFHDYYNYTNADYDQFALDVNVPYDSNIYISPRSHQPPAQGFTKELRNNSFFNAKNVYKFSRDLIINYYSIAPILASNKREIDDLYSSLGNLTYFPLHHNLRTAADFSLPSPTPIYGGNSYVTNLSYMDVDVFGAFDFSDNQVANFPINIPTLGNITNVESVFLQGLWVDSDINYSMRHGGTDDCNNIYTSGSQTAYIRDKLWDPSPDNPDNYVVDLDPCTEYYAYNLDYSKVIKEKPIFPIATNFDYCSNCLFDYPYRVQASLQAFQEEVVDNYTIFRQGDYADLLGSGGNIKALAVDKDELYAICERLSWFIPTRPQTLQTNENLTYLGTGERLSIPPKKLTTVDHTYGGTDHAFSVVSTEFGTCYVDAKTGKVFLIAGQLAELSKQKIRQLLIKQLPLKIKQQFTELTNTEYPFLDSITDDFGAGVQTTYDPRKRRLFITKKDFRVINFGGLVTDNPPSNVVLWDEDSNRFVVYTSSGTVTYPQIDDSEYFENHSFTLSYSFVDQAWVSFHSFLPSFMWNDGYTFYSTNRDSKIWTHNAENFQTYYGTISDFVIEYITNPSPVVTKTFGPLKFFANFEIPTDDEFVNTDVSFFDRIWCYNSFQSTGLQTIIKKLDSTPFAGFNDTSTTVVAEKVNRTWQLNNIRNYIADYSLPISSSKWEDLNESYFIDKVPNDSAYDFNKSLFELERLRDHWMAVRLYYTPQKTDSPTPAKVTLDLVNNDSSNSYR